MMKRVAKKIMHQGKKTAQKCFGKTSAKISPNAAKPHVQRLRRNADFFDMGARTTFWLIAYDVGTPKSNIAATIKMTDTVVHHIGNHSAWRRISGPT
jgi:hypothetical protein